MKFSLIIYSSPQDQLAYQTPFRYAQTLLEQGHELYRVFFYGDGVHTCADGSLESHSAELTGAGSQWADLAHKHDLDMVVCVTAALERGIAREEKLDHPACDGNQQSKTEIRGILDGFQLSGLGQLVDAMANSDRTITFR
ncbi:sulfurtransferase complex subunit TusD [Aestuariicella sp. G3-2]|uniref:sulfurtransferase complex subunit TusD n=1 Tax=Pseudomaricurvus albidus TaxID=2842452 RepID=UPI001C0AEF1D|nr:sulfurtransferase complex subunit TusD [Aestuariicella albida]MBU3070482.1 sulfurtransferase complex subunit TusD [Aestuariicella albida]